MIDKPSSKEQEYFTEKEAQRRKKKEEQLKAERQKAERERLKQLHFMHCPKCGMALEEITYHDIKVDRCTECRGVWLDKGELDQVTKFQEVGFITELLSFMRGK